MSYLLLLIGFVLLIKGADAFVDSSSYIARKFKIPSIIVGMTIVAMGTSAPELSVSITSSLAGMNDMSIANVVGSNIFNLAAVLGISSFFGKLKISNKEDIATMLASALLLIACVLDIGLSCSRLSMIDGAFLLIAFISYIYDMIRKAKHIESPEEETKNKSMFKTILIGLLGLAAIVYGGDLVVNSASAIATQLGMSENLIGLTVVALGTSLPELVTSVIATKKGETGIAIGNVIGSNIFNILLILGTASLISPMTVSTFAIIDILIMIGFILVFIFLTHKKQEVNKITGITMLMLYVSYLIYTIMR